MTPPAITTTISHPLPALFQQSPDISTAGSSPQLLQLITQGAEALVYRTNFLTDQTACALKFRPSKAYRHRTLDVRLTRARILAEARVLVRCRKEGVPVPAVLGLDWEEGWLAMEWIDGQTVRLCLDQYLRAMEEKDGTAKPETNEELRHLMKRVGCVIGRMHHVGIIHGDLTTSNLMLRPPTTPVANSEEEKEAKSLEGEVVLIDFGLAVQSIQDEDKAVDLYVLERAFGSTHPQAEELFKEALHSYGESYKGAKVVLKRLEDVRLRGRKKSMLG